MRVPQFFEAVKKAFKSKYQEVHNCGGNDPTDGAINDCTYIERFRDVLPGSANHLHCLYQETIAEHSKPDRIIDKNDHGSRYQDGYYQ